VSGATTNNGSGPGPVAHNDVVARLAVIGRHAMMPSIKPYELAGRLILVGHAYREKIVDPGHDVEVDTADCTIFTVTHREVADQFDVDDYQQAMALLDDSLVAISEVILWERANERMGKSSPFQRRVGRVDVKFFSIDGETASDVMWKNPLYFTNLDGMSMMASFLGNMVMTNGPAASPLPADAKRIMSSIDLVNLGFFTEAFVAAFALLDDMVQRVVAGGLEAKGFAEKEQSDFSRSIREDRLNNYLNRVVKLCDWTALEDVDSELNKKMLKTNRLRNSVMHGDRELARAEALEAISVIVRVIDHLRGNPFGVQIVGFPPLRPAEPQLARMPPPGTRESGVDPSEANASEPAAAGESPES
jgi:hypothetical protein